MGEEKREKMRKTMEELKNLVAKEVVPVKDLLDAGAMTECVHMNWAFREGNGNFRPTDLGKAMVGRQET